jgi:CBS-domain-containing membrane protein
MNPLKKFLPYLISESTPLSTSEKLRSTLAAFIALLVVGLTSSYLFHGYGLPLLIASMGASATLMFGWLHLWR